MATLHLIRQSAYTTQDFAQCIQILNNNNDAIVFIDDGCYNVTHPLLTQINEQIPLYIIDVHLTARALKLPNNRIKTISMTELVSLTFTLDKAITWQ